MDQRRADAFIDLLLGAAGAPVAQVRVTAPAGTLLSLDGQPAELAGYGPIPADQARELAADGTWRRLLTDPASGTVLDYGRSTYRPPKPLADFVRARDVTCRFPAADGPRTTATWTTASPTHRDPPAPITWTPCAPTITG